MRIALLTDGITPYVVGGIQRHSALLTQHLAGLGAHIDLYHSDCGSGRRNEARTLQGFPLDGRERITNHFVDYPTPRSFPGHFIADSLALSQRFFERYRKNPRADFIYAKSLTGWAFLKAKRGRVELPKIGVNAHGYEMFQRSPDLRAAIGNLLFRPFFRSISRRADAVFSYGGKITELLKSKVGVRPDRIIEIPTGVDANWIRAKVLPAHQPVRFVFLGRHERRKGIEELSETPPCLRICGRFHRSHPGKQPAEKGIREVSWTSHGSC